LDHGDEALEEEESEERRGLKRGKNHPGSDPPGTRINSMNRLPDPTPTSGKENIDNGNILTRAPLTNSGCSRFSMLEENMEEDMEED